MSGNMPDFLKRAQQGKQARRRAQEDKTNEAPSTRVVPRSTADRSARQPAPQQPAAGRAPQPADPRPAVQHDDFVPDEPATEAVDTLDVHPVTVMPTPEASQVPDPASAPAAGSAARPVAGPATPAASAPTDQPTLPGMPRVVQPAAVPNPRADIEALNELEQHLYAHRYAEILMGCTGPSIDPPAATKDRGEAMAILMQEDQELLCSPQTGALFDRLSDETDDELLNDTQRAQVRVLRRDRARLVDVPSDEQAAFERLTTEAEAAWRAAKAAGDWASFEPYLDRIVSSMRRLADYKRPGADPYDVWLDEFEQGTDQAFYDRFFDAVKETVVPLLAAVSKKPKLTRHYVEGRFDERRQWDLARDLVRLEGIDPDTLLLTHTEHPYSDALTTNYAVIAAHTYENDVLSNVYTMLHEGGHALYEQGVDPAYNYTSLKGGTSSGIHEGQSRFFENYVGRSEAFAGPLLAVLRRHFPGQFGRVTARQLYLAANRVEAQPIRTEADELTYPLHILVRYEIERALLHGEATAADVPALWTDKYHEYLGIRVPNDARGALQDTHWSGGMLGYFPTYALGGAYGAQLRHAMIVDGLDWQGTLASGNLAPVREWLRQRVWRYGRAKDPMEIIEGACGEPFDVSYYTDYLVDKFSGIYGL